MIWNLSFTHLEELPDAWLLSLFSYKEELALHWTPLFKELLYHKIVQSEKKLYEIYEYMKMYPKNVSLNLGSISKIPWKRRMKNALEEMRELEEKKTFKSPCQFWKNFVSGIDLTTAEETTITSTLWASHRCSSC